MSLTSRRSSALAAALLLGFVQAALAAPTASELQIDTGRSDGELVLSGHDARQQLVVTAVTNEGSKVDVTSDVRYSAEPEGIVAVDQRGYIKPLTDGTTIVTAQLEGGPSTTLSVTVENAQHIDVVNFPNEIVPVFTKHSCNSGGCHGKSGGQNGFALSLLGFEPTEDYEHLVLEGRERRIFLPAPERSLLLQKASGQMPHGGGDRFDTDSHAYRMITRWIEQGLPYGDPEAAKVARIEVFPPARLMQPETSQQVVTIAHYSDGTTRDVTALTQYEANIPEMAEVDVRGRVTVADQPGDVAVMARYQGQVATFAATIPLGAPVNELPPAENFIDELVFAKLKKLGVPPSEICDDATFIRRASLDIAGRLPTLEETKDFLSNRDPAKREKLVDRLLASGDHADFFAGKWSAILRNKRRDDSYKHGTYAFYAWLREQIHDNTPYDEMVRGVLAASGDIAQNPPVVWYREVNNVEQQVEDSAQLFLGVRIKCARCHHHPYEKWSQKDYYGYAAFFSQVGQKKSVIPGDVRVYHEWGNATSRNPKTGNNLPPTGFGGEPLETDPGVDPRQRLVDWMSQEENPFFAHTLVNRYWKHFLGRGLVEPEDDMRATNPATNPALLDALADHFVESGFDMKDLIRTICTSSTYQLSSIPNKYNADEKQNFSRYYPRRLPAEVLLDSVNTLTGTQTSFNGMPKGTRAIALPDSDFDSYFLQVFGRPAMESACECERIGDASIIQSLHIINSREIHDKLSSGRAEDLQRDEDRSFEDKIHDLYLLAFARPPSNEEIGAIDAYFKEKQQEGQLNEKQIWEDVLWSLMYSKEFLFNK